MRPSNSKLGGAPNQELIHTWWPNTQVAEFELGKKSLGGPVPKFELDGNIQY
jgi:hypothetical protein